MTEGEALENFWLNVIIQAFIDLSSVATSRASIINKKASNEWMNLNNNNFISVCEYANLDPKKVIKIKKEFLNSDKKIRIFKTEIKKKFDFKNIKF